MRGGGPLTDERLSLNVSGSLSSSSEMCPSGKTAAIRFQAVEGPASSMFSVLVTAATGRLWEVLFTLAQAASRVVRGLYPFPESTTVQLDEQWPAKKRQHLKHPSFSCRSCCSSVVSFGGYGLSVVVSVLVVCEGVLLRGWLLNGLFGPRMNCSISSRLRLRSDWHLRSRLRTLSIQGRSPSVLFPLSSAAKIRRSLSRATSS